MPIRSANGPTLSHEDFERLTPFEWEALHRLAAMDGFSTVCAMHKDTTDWLQRIAVQDFVNCEFAILRQYTATPAVPLGSSVVKLDDQVIVAMARSASRLVGVLRGEHRCPSSPLALEFSRGHFL